MRDSDPEGRFPMKNRIDVLKRVPVLLYHHIQPGGFNTVKPQLFERHISFLKKEGYTGVTFRQLLFDADLPDNPVVITFDDGYETIYRYALPILEKAGFNAVVFMLAGYMGKKNSWDLSLEPRSVRHLNAEELTGLNNKGWEIASHAMSHKPLTTLPIPELRWEVERSGQCLEELLNVKTTGFAYPFGRYNHAVREMVEQTGYHYACGALKRHQLPESEFQLVRIPVYRFDSIHSIRRKLFYPEIPRLEYLKLKLISGLSRLTPLYQKLKVGSE